MATLKYDPELFLNPTAENMVVRALAGQIPVAVSQLSFKPSEAVEDYLLHDLNGWEMSTFFQHYKSFTSEQDMLDAFGWTIDEPALEDTGMSLTNGTG